MGSVELTGEPTSDNCTYLDKDRSKNWHHTTVNRSTVANISTLEERLSDTQRYPQLTVLRPSSIRQAPITRFTRWIPRRRPWGWCQRLLGQLTDTVKQQRSTFHEHGTRHLGTHLRCGRRCNRWARGRLDQTLRLRDSMDEDEMARGRSSNGTERDRPTVPCFLRCQHGRNGHRCRCSVFGVRSLPFLKERV